MRWRGTCHLLQLHYLTFQQVGSKPLTQGVGDVVPKGFSSITAVQRWPPVSFIVSSPTENRVSSHLDTQKKCNSAPVQELVPETPDCVSSRGASMLLNNHSAIIPYPPASLRVCRRGQGRHGQTPWSSRPPWHSTTQSTLRRIPRHSGCSRATSPHSATAGIRCHWRYPRKEQVPSHTVSLVI